MFRILQIYALLETFAIATLIQLSILSQTNYNESPQRGSSVSICLPPTDWQILELADIYKSDYIHRHSNPPGDKGLHDIETMIFL